MFGLVGIIKFNVLIVGGMYPVRTDWGLPLSIMTVLVIQYGRLWMD